MQGQQSINGNGTLNLNSGMSVAEGEDSRAQRKGKRNYVCKTCKKSFKRREHCARHERGHTKEKPYLCRYCRRSYARRDLATRHEKSLHADQWTAPARSSRTTIDATHDQESNSSHGQDDASHEDEDPPVTDQNGFDVQAPLISPMMEAHGEGFILGDVLMPSSPPSLPDMSSMQGGANHFDNTGMIQGTSLPPLTTSSLSSNPMDSFQALAALQYSHFPHEFSQDGHNQFGPLDGGAISHAGHRASFSQANNHMQHSPENFMGNFPPYNWNDLGATNSESPSSVDKRSSNKILSLELDDETHAYLDIDMKNRLAPHLRQRFKLPIRNIMDRFLSSYLTCFHDHFPIIPVASLKLTNVPAPLVIAMCAIGALFRLDRKHATNLRDWVDQALASEKLKNATVGIFTSFPIWMAQSKLLSLYAALFAGDLFTFTLALQSMGSLTTEYRHRRIALTSRPIDSLALSWIDWIERETSKRILYGTLILNDLISITYGITPRMCIIPDADIEMPDDERLWDASSEMQWTELMVLQGPVHCITLRSALNQIISGRGAELENGAFLRWSPFAATIIMHGMSFYLFHIVQSAQAFTNFTLDEPQGSLRANLLAQAESALSRCSELFLGGSPEEHQRLNELAASPRSNCVALLRTAFVRPANAEYSFDRVIVLGADPRTIQSELQLFVASQQPRGEFVTKAVKWAYHGLQTSIKAGHLLVKKTAAFKWGLDHAIADWDCALFVARWIHTLSHQHQQHPPDANESKNLRELKELLVDMKVKFTSQTSLAAEITRVWAGFFDDTWVWGITPRQGAVLRQLADAYDFDWRSRDGMNN